MIALAIALVMGEVLGFAAFVLLLRSKRPPAADLPEERLKNLEERLGIMEAERMITRPRVAR